jgi:phosphoadenosine phosphosulfate reductase
MVSQVNKNIPILFLETGKHFPETLQYVDDLKKDLGLKNIIALKPDENILVHADPNGNLWSSNVDRCCWIRKVEPLDRYLAQAKIEAVITGRRAYQTKERQQIQKIELDDQGRIRINPVAFWDKNRIHRQFDELRLPQHPLVVQGYPSIGCAPCTRQVHPGEDERAGRWAHIVDLQPESQQKTECGIHLNRDDIKDFAI